MKETKICKRCIMPESKPDIYINDEGICNICVAHDNSRESINEQKPLESDLLKILDKHKGRKKFDCMVMCSGGKDSTAALYFMKKRYNLNILAFMFDHGFETKEARANVESAVQKLGVDFLLYKSSYMKPMFARMIESESKAIICHTCSIWYMELAFDVAARYDIPLIVAGWTKGQYKKQNIVSKYGTDDGTCEFKAMSESTRSFLDNNISDMHQYKNFPKSMDEVIKKARKKHKAKVISPHWFLPYGPDEYVKIIEDELEWKAPDLSYPKGSTNCTLNFISVHQSIKHYGYTHYVVEASKLIREGVITREEALEQVKINFDDKTLKEVASGLCIDFSTYL
ncbi:MAG: hypothetical protein C0596_12905 [Marinilabiliales bacterium]|nr:MAG: hypothetical protein C0596_12905 [Marinilabiliales bacterium]